MNQINIESIENSHRFMNNGLLTKEKLKKRLKPLLRKLITI